MFLKTTVSSRPLAALKDQIEEALTALCDTAQLAQQENVFRSQWLDVQHLAPAVWVDRAFVPFHLRRDDIEVFCLYRCAPCDRAPTGQWVLLGGVERIPHCCCGRTRSAEPPPPLSPSSPARPDDTADPEPRPEPRPDAAQPGTEGQAGGQAGGQPGGQAGGQAAAEPCCGRCRRWVWIEASEELPLERDELRAILDLCLGNDVAGAAPWPVDQQEQGVAVWVRRARALRRQAQARKAGKPRLASTEQLETWMRTLDDPGHCMQFKEPWKALRRMEPGSDEIEDLDKAFQSVAIRCRDRIMEERNKRKG